MSLEWFIQRRVSMKRLLRITGSRLRFNVRLEMFGAKRLCSRTSAIPTVFQVSLRKRSSSLHNALSIFRSIDDLSSAAIALEGIARAEQKRGNLADARKHIEESLALRETVRSRSGSLQLRASYRATVEKAYEFYIDVLMQQKLDAAALHASERGRARSLLERLSEARIDIRQGVDASLIEKERDLTRVLNAKAQREMQLKARKGSTEEISTLQREISTLEDEYQQVQAAIRKSSPQYSALTQPQPLDLKGIQQQLDPNTVLLEYSLGEERSYVWVITHDSLKTYTLPKREEVENVAGRVYESLVARSVVKSLEAPGQRRTRIAGADTEFQKAANELSRMILAPASADFGRKRLIVIADGALQYVPFAALSIAPNRPLIVDHELVSLPSASTFALQRQNLANRPLAPKAVAVIADPVFSIADERFGASAGQRIGFDANHRALARWSRRSTLDPASAVHSLGSRSDSRRLPCRLNVEGS